MSASISLFLIRKFDSKRTPYFDLTLKLKRHEIILPCLQSGDQEIMKVSFRRVRNPFPRRGEQQSKVNSEISHDKSHLPDLKELQMQLNQYKPGEIRKLVTLYVYEKLPPEISEQFQRKIQALEEASANHAGYPYTLPDLTDDSDCLRVLAKAVYGGFALNNLGEIQLEEKTETVTTNNSGDKQEEKTKIITNRYSINAYSEERDIINHFSKLFGLASEESWGIFLPSGTDGNLYGAKCGYDRLKDQQPSLFGSEASHYSIIRAGNFLGLPREKIITVPSQPNGEIDYEALEQIAKNGELGDAVIGFMNYGTTFTNAIDDPRVVSEILDRYGLGSEKRHLHQDGALAGGMYPYMQESLKQKLPSFGFGNSCVDTLSISMHKWPGTDVGSVLLGRISRIGQEELVEYIGASRRVGSRDGGPIFDAWLKIGLTTPESEREKVERCINYAEYIGKELQGAGIDGVSVQLNTIVFPCPSEELLRKYTLVPQTNTHTSKKEAHIIVMPQHKLGLLRQITTDSEKDLLGRITTDSEKDLGSKDSSTNFSNHKVGV
ncbi:MAG: pyridoxal-dependent decarboxylase [Candidatus Caenarcaniphilales bacterium]|nr:pyridoxal-dependent decarboxylase [Candidatus Caenarcaniphilales bacterium]